MLLNRVHLIHDAYTNAGHLKNGMHNCLNDILFFILGAAYPFHPYGDIHYDPTQMNHGLPVPGSTALPESSSQSTGLMSSLTDMSPTCASLNLDEQQQTTPAQAPTPAQTQSSPQTMSSTSLTSPETQQQPVLHPSMNGTWTDSLSMVATR